LYFFLLSIINLVKYLQNHLLSINSHLIDFKLHSIIPIILHFILIVIFHLLYNFLLAVVFLIFVLILNPLILILVFDLLIHLDFILNHLDFILIQLFLLYLYFPSIKYFLPISLHLKEYLQFFPINPLFILYFPLIINSKSPCFFIPYNE